MRAPFLALLLLAGMQTLCAQLRQPAFIEYIEKHAPLAVDQMQRYNIPASITLAQGLHESAAGRSRLAIEANNHFGIKVGSAWTGPYIIKSDDRPDDRFRKYSSTQESYEDHSQFLLQKRYQPLFALSKTDYKGWAHGLRNCGYATNPAYAQSLIRLIEDYELYRYDSSKVSRKTASSGYAICNDLCYTTVCDGESIASIAKRTKVSKRKLIKYNELTSSYVLTVGDRLYLKKKRTKAEKIYKNHPHTVQPGESMHSISQLYGIRVASLYKINKLPLYYSPCPGDRLRVR